MSTSGSPKQVVEIDPRILKDAVRSFIPVLFAIQVASLGDVLKIKRKVEKPDSGRSITDKFSDTADLKGMVKAAVAARVLSAAAEVFSGLRDAENVIAQINGLNQKMLSEAIDSNQPKKHISKIDGLAGREYREYVQTHPANEEERAERSRAAWQYIKKLCEILAEGTPATTAKARLERATTVDVSIIQSAIEDFQYLLLWSVDTVSSLPNPAVAPAMRPDG
ncbi:MAG: hypothetical protein H6853_07940 [Rhodospirillales bacterium]|nr:hypothetical protein [Alphaproteobacteria bacterium]USO03446.1 MAG: hypothetical protein H6853_07940 [Rhodospirillales bacterium]